MIVDILKWDQYDNSFNSFCDARDVRIMMSVSVKVDSTLGVFLALICCEIVLVESTCHVVQDNGTAARPKVRPLSATKMNVYWTDVFENCTGEETVLIREVFK